MPPSEIHLTHIEDVENSVEVLPPTHDRIFVGLRMECSRDRMSFTLVGDLPADLGHSSAIETLVSGLLSRQTVGWTHLVSSSIASSPD